MQLLRVSKKLLVYFLTRFSADGISPGKYSVLMELLAADRAVAPSTLADRIGVSRPTVTGLIDGLCGQGYVERETDPEDRRRLRVGLTAAGRRFMDSLLPRQFELMAGVLDTLEAHDREALRSLLGKLEARLT